MGLFTTLFCGAGAGKTALAWSAAPNAAVCTTNPDNLRPIEDLFGQKFDSKNVLICETMEDIIDFVSERKHLPLILDEFNEVLISELEDIDPEGVMENYPLYRSLNSRVMPWLKAVRDNAEHPTIITTSEVDIKEKKNVKGDKYYTSGGPAFQGTAQRKGICHMSHHLFHITSKPSIKGPWPFALQVKKSGDWEAKCRSPASVPKFLPMSLSEIYRKSGYECTPVFEGQADARARAIEAMESRDRAGIQAIMDDFISRGVTPWTVSIAFNEAACHLAIVKYQDEEGSMISKSYI